MKFNSFLKGYPRTVCTHADCVKNVKIGITYKTDYIQHCHPHCHLKGVKQEVINNPKLISCACMEGKDNCIVCSHHWSQHM